jgi:hypothetical protein
MKGDFRYPQQFGRQVLMDGEYIDTGERWAKSADGKYRCVGRMETLTQEEVDMEVMAKNLFPIEVRNTFGNIP